MTEPLEPPEEGPEAPPRLDRQAADPTSEASEDAPARNSWARTTGGVVLVLLATALVTVQIAGVLFRDLAEHRVAALAEPPPTPTPAAAADTPARKPSRLGADVHEVVVGTARAPETTPVPAAAPEPTTPVEPPVAETPTGAPAEPAPPRAGTGLQVGIFRSQKYRKEAEDTLDRLGAPHFRLRATRRGVGFRLVVPTPTADTRNRVAAIFGERGVLSARADDQIIAYFHMEEEVQAVLGALSEAGIQAGYGRFDGDMPLWTVLAGPFDEAQTNRWETRLHEAGLDTYRRTLP